MSFRLLKAIARTPALAYRERRSVLSTLATFADNKTFIAYPSITTLANYLNKTRRAVMLVLAKLASDGWITRTPSSSKVGTTVYEIQLDNFGKAMIAEIQGQVGTANSHNTSFGNYPKGKIEVNEDSLSDEYIFTGEVNGCSHNHTNYQINEQTNSKISNANASLAQSKQKHHQSEGKNKNITLQSHVEKKKTQQQIESTKALPEKSKDSKLVQAWKAAHETAGIAVIVTAKDGRMLRQLTQGPDAIPYNEVVDILIPRYVQDWPYVYEMLQGGPGKYKTPKKPNLKSLLKNRKIIFKFCT